MTSSESADARLALQLEPIGPDRYAGLHPGRGGRDMVFGGSLLAQHAVVASRSDPGKFVESSSAIFFRKVLADVPVEIVAVPVHVGRLFSTVRTTIVQEERECSSALTLLTAREDDLIRHATPAPAVGTPDDATPRIDSFPGRETRVVGGVDIMDATSVGEPEVAVWVRYPWAVDLVGVERQALIAHASASFVIGTAMRPHPGIGQSIAHRDISSGVIAHAVSFHEDCDPSDWMLVVQESPYTGRGRAHGRGQVFTCDGAIVASFNQEAMIRHFSEGRHPTGSEASTL